MIHKKWHFQLFGIMTHNKLACKSLMLDSQTAKNPKLNEGFINQLHAVREANEYVRVMRQNPTLKLHAVEVFCYECTWSDLPGDYELKNTLEVINALSVGKPKITYPK